MGMDAYCLSELGFIGLMGLLGNYNFYLHLKNPTHPINPSSDYFWIVTGVPAGI